MQGDFSLVYSIRCDCAPSQLEPLCHIPLPHGSPLGKYASLHYQAGDGWPATFLCLRHGSACVRSPEDIRSDLEMRTPGSPPSPVWLIGCVCVHPNCGRRHTIYATGATSWADVWRRVLKLSPRVPCGDHDLQWRKDLMRGAVLAHD